MKMGPSTLQSGCATRFEWDPTSPRHQVVSPAPLQRARGPTFGREPNKISTRRPPAPAKHSDGQWDGPTSTLKWMGNNLRVGGNSLQAPEGLSRSPAESSAPTLSQEPANGAVSGSPRPDEAQTKMKMGPWTLQRGWASRFEWDPTSPWHQMVSPAPLQRA